MGPLKKDATTRERMFSVYRSVYLRVTGSGRENGARVTPVLHLSDLK